MPEIFTTTTPEVIAEVASRLRESGVAILPTDTIYGLHAVATDEAAVGRIYALKSRDAGKPLVVIAQSFDAMEELGVDTGDERLLPLRDIWPAPLTAIVPASSSLPAAAGRAQIAVRVPAVEWLRDLLSRTGPLVSTSVNYAGDPPAVSLDSVPGTILAGSDVAVDAGALEGAPSTIIDLTRGAPELLREGAFRFSQFLWKTPRKRL